jgi:VWFA-related protein
MWRVIELSATSGHGDRHPEIFRFAMRLESQRVRAFLGRALGGSARLVAGILLLFVVFLHAASLTAENRASEPGSTAKPFAEIDLSPAGYQSLAQSERLTDDSNVSLDFVDQNHVLFTFDLKKLFKRLPECPPTHQDRLVRAVILELPSGKIVRQADWYLHDRRRYLWPLGSGRFLLRKLNSLYLVDSSLHEKLLTTASRDLLWVTVTPDGKEIIAETADNDAAAEKLREHSSPAKQETRMEFLDANSMAVLRTIKFKGVVNLEATSSGFADTVHKGDLWLIRFGPTPRKRANIARVRSRCVPEVFYSAANAMLVGRCSWDSADYSVSAFTVSGIRLWRQHWSEHRYFPRIVRSEDGSRFGVSTARLAPGPAGGSDDGDANHDLEQTVQILETASGNPVLSTKVTPVLLTGQNFSLAPDGRQLAVLHDSRLQLYDLPSLSEEERVKYAALKADAPDLYLPSSKPQIPLPSGNAGQAASSDSTRDEETTYVAAEATPEPAIEGDDGEAQSAVASGSASANETGKRRSASSAPGSSGPPPAQATTEKVTAVANSSIPVFRVGTQAVVVDVVATDAKGHPAKGLREQDFRVFENGKPQAVRYFQEFTGGEAAQTSGAPPSPPLHLPPNVFTNNTQAPDPGSVTILLLDLLNTPMTDQQRAREQLVKFLQSKTKDSEFALCTLSTDLAAHLRLIQGFTADENLVIAAVNGKKGATHGVSWLDAGVGLENSLNGVRRMAQSDPIEWQAVAQQMAQMAAEERVVDTDARVGITIDALKQLARYLSGIPGRKNLIWLSGSFPITLLPSDDFYAPVTENRNYAGQIKEATNLLAESHVAVYPVDVRGLAVSDLYGASNERNFAPSGVPIGADPIDLSPNGLINGGTAGASDTLNLVAPTQIFQQQMEHDMDLRATEQDTMKQIAADTGGRAFYNTNALGQAIATAAEQGSNYYTISYTPADRNYNGKFRKIKISLDQKGYQLHYRRGYFAVDPYAPVKDKDLSRNIGMAAMQHGSPQSRQILFAVRVVPVGLPKMFDKSQEGPVRLASGNKRLDVAGLTEMQHYRIDYAVDSSDLRYLPIDKGLHHGVLNFMVTAFDDDGKLLTGVGSTAISNLKPAGYRDVILGGFRARQEIDVPLQATSLRLGVEDQLSSHLGTVELPLPLPAPPDVPRIVKHSLPEVEPD